jgi:hypothetical protein
VSGFSRIWMRGRLIDLFVRMVVAAGGAGVARTQEPFSWRRALAIGIVAAAIAYAVLSFVYAW